MSRKLVIFSLSLILGLSIIPIANHLGLAPVARATPTMPTISVQGEFYASPYIVDPSLVPGASVNVTVEASSLPAIIDSTDGGIQGFDITLSYNSSILRPELTSVNGPFCNVDDSCLWANLTQRQFLIFANQVNGTAGTLRYGMVVYNQAYRGVADGTLFKIGFKVIGLGKTPINVDASSLLIGFYQNCGSSITNYSIQNGIFDNRRPWTITANPVTTTMSRNSTAIISLTVSWVNSPDNTNVTMILLSGTGNLTSLIRNGEFSFVPLIGRLDPSAGLYSFSSILTLNSSNTAPLGRYVLPIVGHETGSYDPYLQYTLNYTIIVDPSGPNVVDVQREVASDSASNWMLSQSSTFLADPALPLVANFTFAASTLSVTFAAIACGGTLPFTYMWDFGDGITGSTGAVVHDYSKSGNYLVTLKVADANGKSFTVTRSVSVSTGSDVLLYAGLVGLGLLVTVFIGAIFLRRGHRR